MSSPLCWNLYKDNKLQRAIKYRWTNWLQYIIPSKRCTLLRIWGDSVMMVPYSRIKRLTANPMPATCSWNILGGKPFLSGSANQALVLMFLMLIVWSWTFIFHNMVPSVKVFSTTWLVVTRSLRVNYRSKEWVTQTCIHCQSLLNSGI